MTGDRPVEPLRRVGRYAGIGLYLTVGYLAALFWLLYVTAGDASHGWTA